MARVMEKMVHGKEIAARQAAAAPRMNNISNQSHGGNKSIMNLDVRATPLSPSSLETYMTADDTQSSSRHGEIPQHVVVDQSSGAENSNGDMES